MAGCATPASTTEKTPRQLIVASASDMTNALPELAKDFETRSGIKVVPSYGPSGALAQQIANGAPFDVFLSADRRFVLQLSENGHIAKDLRAIYAVGHLVLYAPKLHLDSIGALRGKDVQRFSIANPELAPYGRAAKQALERSGVWNSARSKVVIAENIRQALQMVETGNVDATLTSRSLLLNESGATLLDVPENLYDQIQQEAGVVSRAQANPDARAFLNYLSSADGKRILQKYGFGIPATKE